MVDASTRETRTASLAIFYDVAQDDQYRCRLDRRWVRTAVLLEAELYVWSYCCTAGG